MPDLNFKPDVLSVEYVKEHGVLYNEYIFYSENEECEPLYDKDPSLGGKPFTGLLYELDFNGVLRYYQYYENGFGNGEYVTFYDTGAVASYCVMERFEYVGKLYKWYKNGNLKCYHEKDSNRRDIKTINFDENGKITLLIENGKAKVEKGVAK